MKRIDMTGRRMGHLLVLRCEGHTIRPDGKLGQLTWRCRCACGKETVVAGANLRKRTKPTRSCGCYDGKRTHGQSKALIYNLWVSMIQRCTNPNRDNYKRYGGAGIVVCARWRNSFEAFIVDMGPRPSPQHTIDRINNSSGYTPENCRWATRSEQACNKKNARVFTFRGRTMTLGAWISELAPHLPTTPRAVYKRVDRGVPIAKALGLE